MQQDDMVSEIVDIIDRHRPKQSSQEIAQLRLEKSDIEVKYHGLQQIFLSLQKENESLRKQLKVVCNNLMERR